MKRIIILVLSFLFTASAYAADTAATEASARHLLAVTQSEKIIDAMYAQMDSIIKTSMNQAIAGQPLNTEQRKIIDGVPTKMTALLKEGMSWQLLEPELIDLYRRSFTEKEVKDMISFYQSPSGRAVIAKMPLVMQSSMQIGQRQMEPMMPKLQQLMKDTIEQLKAASNK